MSLKISFINNYNFKNLGEDVARSAFRKIDKNQNGFLDRDDMNRAFGLMDRLYCDEQKPLKSMMNVNEKNPQYHDCD